MGRKAGTEREVGEIFKKTPTVTKQSCFDNLLPPLKKKVCEQSQLLWGTALSHSSEDTACGGKGSKIYGRKVQGNSYNTNSIKKKLSPCCHKLVIITKHAFKNGNDHSLFSMFSRTVDNLIRKDSKKEGCNKNKCKINHDVFSGPHF